MLLQPRDIADCYTLQEIEDEITAIKEAIELARQSKSDSFDDMQARQKVERVNLTELRNDLAVYIKAKNILTGAESSTADLVAANYNPVIPKV